MNVEAFQSKYTAEEIEGVFDLVNAKGKQIDTNAQEIAQIKQETTEMKQETAQIAVNAQEIAKIKQQMESKEMFDIQWVEELPEEEISTATIYMVRDESATDENNLYAEYVYNEETGWECIGTVNATVSVTGCTDQEIIDMVNGIWA